VSIPCSQPIRGNVHRLSNRGPYTIKLFSYLDELRGEAHSKNGRVYTLLGNHEVENLMCKPVFISQVFCKQVWVT